MAGCNPKLSVIHSVISASGYSSNHKRELVTMVDSVAASSTHIVSRQSPIVVK